MVNKDDDDKLYGGDPRVKVSSVAVTSDYPTTMSSYIRTTSLYTILMMLIPVAFLYSIQRLREDHFVATM